MAESSRGVCGYIYVYTYIHIYPYISMCVCIYICTAEILAQTDMYIHVKWLGSRLGSRQCPQDNGLKMVTRWSLAQEGAQRDLQ